MLPCHHASNHHHNRKIKRVGGGLQKRTSKTLAIRLPQEGKGFGFNRGEYRYATGRDRVEYSAAGNRVSPRAETKPAPNKNTNCHGKKERVVERDARSMCVWRPTTDRPRVIMYFARNRCEERHNKGMLTKRVDDTNLKPCMPHGRFNGNRKSQSSAGQYQKKCMPDGRSNHNRRPHRFVRQQLE